MACNRFLLRSAAISRRTGGIWGVGQAGPRTAVAEGLGISLAWRGLLRRHFGGKSDYKRTFGHQGRTPCAAWAPLGMYSGEPQFDPTAGRAKWHQQDPPQWKEKELPPLGMLNPQEYDEKHGRWWFSFKGREDGKRPKLYTTIGRHARSKKLKRTIVRWMGNTPNFRALKRDPYRKRWPKLEQLCVRFFAEFCLKAFERRTLLETAHTLPLYGVGCKFWRGKTPDTPETRGQYFVADSSEFRLRPIRGLLRGTQYMFGRPVRQQVAPIAKSLGSWRYEFPEGAHPAVYRPPFPELRAEARRREASE